MKELGEDYTAPYEEYEENEYSEENNYDEDDDASASEE